jgi:serine/threonine protein kinase/Tol biopolymer transport system component
VRLTPGARLGPYEIVAPLGAGGMGEVYRARDTRLGRDVAVKILSVDTSSSPGAHQRFEREARTISQLSHPHICALYDVGEAPGPQSPAPSPYLVMELLDGETLAQRLARGPLPLEQTLRYGAEIADALEAAHRQGVVHRDLKPGNIMITKSGVKLLDFGLAKALEVPQVELTSQRTAAIPGDLTEKGTALGTLQYMSPEQVEGRSADARSDIFAFGAVLFEMATGRKAFPGTSAGAVASAILRDDPQPIAASPVLDRLVRICLAKDPEHRWQTARDVQLQLGSLPASGPVAVTAATPRLRGRLLSLVPWALAALAAVIAVAIVVRTRPPAPSAAWSSVVRFPVPPPLGGSFFESYESTTLSVSPDGSTIAFSGQSGDEPRRIWLRSLAELEARPLAGTDGGSSMFWSPDGRSLAYFAGGKLRRIEVRGGAPVSICDVREVIGFAGTWGADGQILFASIEGEAIWSVPASGGAPVALLKADPSLNLMRLNWPVFLPDGRRFLYLQRRADGSGHLMLAEPGVAPREVRPMQSNAGYAAPGYLLFAAEGALLAQRFDASKGTVSGEPFSVAPQVAYFFTTSVAGFATSPGGALVYSGHDDEQRLIWFDRTGRNLGAIGDPGRYQSPRLSPDGRRLAFDRFKAGAFDIWELDFERGNETRLTFGQSSEGGTVWSPDGRSLFFRADQGAPPRIFRKDLVSGRETLALPGSGTMQEAEDLSRDGRTLLFTQRTVGGFDIWQWPTDDSRPATVVAATPFDEQSVRFAPDGRAISFHSNVSGRYEVYVAPFPPTGQQTRVSTAGGYLARWSRDGRELYYLGGDGRLMAAPVQTTGPVALGAPIALFAMAPPWADFDVDSTGRFVAVVTERRSAQQPLTAVLNWTAALDR